MDNSINYGKCNHVIMERTAPKRVLAVAGHPDLHKVHMSQPARLRVSASGQTYVTDRHRPCRLWFHLHRGFLISLAAETNGAVLWTRH
jgi:hypothetical protein